MHFLQMQAVYTLLKQFEQAVSDCKTAIKLVRAYMPPPLHVLACVVDTVTPQLIPTAMHRRIPHT